MEGVGMETIAKDYYREYQASNEILRPHYFLADTIMHFKPKSVFEFGCGTGKNLKLLKTRDPFLNVEGIDVSWRNIDYAHRQNNVNFCRLGDEESLKHIESKSIDVIFTCSVLDHIEDINNILEEFGRIAKKAIVLFETNDKSKRYPDFYYPHDYVRLGTMTKMNYEYVSNEAPDADGCTYGIWIKNLV